MQAGEFPGNGNFESPVSVGESHGGFDLPGAIFRSDLLRNPLIILISRVFALLAGQEALSDNIFICKLEKSQKSLERWCFGKNGAVIKKSWEWAMVFPKKKPTLRGDKAFIFSLPGFFK